MDAEPILLPKICDVRSHFRVSIGDAILLVDRLKMRLGQELVGDAAGTEHGTQRSGATPVRKPLPGAHLPAAVPWTNTGEHDFSPRQSRRPATLLLYAHRCGQCGRLANELKATRPSFPQACGQPRLRAFRLQRDFTGEGRCQKARSSISPHFPCTPGKNPTPRPDPAPSPSTRPPLTSFRTPITPPGSLACRNSATSIPAS